MPSKQIRSRWSSQFEELSNQSKFHEKVRHILCTDQFLSGLQCYQEVPVKDLCEGYSSTHWFDWYIDELDTVIELHGQQHYKVVNRGNVSYEQAQSDFANGQKRDSAKKAAAIRNGYKYVEISYKHYKKLDATSFKEMIFKEQK